MKKTAVVCTKCKGTRYVAPPVPAAYVCTRCTGQPPKAVTTKPTKPSTADPWTRNDARSRVAAKPRWIGKRKWGWLKDETGRNGR